MYKRYIECQPERAIQGNFSSGQFSFKWDLGTQVCFNPSKSYIRFRLKLRKGDGTPFNVAEEDLNVAINYYACDNFFQQICQKINGQCVGYLNDYVPQCSALKRRMNLSQNVKESILSSVDTSQIHFNDRYQQTLTNGISTRKGTFLRRGHNVAAEAHQGGRLSFLDLTTPNRVTFDNANNRIIFTPNGGAEIPDLSHHISIGDTIYYNDGNERVTYVTGYHSTNTYRDSLNCQAINNGVGAANLINQVRLATDHIIDRTVASIYPSNQVDGTPTNNRELLWRPALGFWQIDNWLPGGGMYELVLTPQPDALLQRYAVETIGNRQPGATAIDYQFEITDVQMYLFCTIGKKGSSISHDFEEVSCSSQNLTSKSLTSKEYDVRESNTGITIALQDPDAGNNTSFSRSKFRVRQDYERKLVRYYVQKDGITLPDPIPSTLDSDAAVLYTQPYYDNHAYLGTLHLEKVETLSEYMDAGMYIHHEFMGSMHKQSNIHVYTQFGADLPSLGGVITYPSLLMFDHYLCSLKIQASEGKVTGVSFE